ncbi:MAG TPA: hypothetical protein H9935_00870 [Candidatus Blautia merdigallinarum]|uniref:Uncharacterized protein n=1 Tax=Candidatus Blautia merdigallinarum TaxID=2838495 RepID=A0A9D2SJC8_9FIRM|nr:hypothetical protein [Candidatus Blautia merdigallinarum]
MAGEVPGVMSVRAIVFHNRNTVAFSFFLAFSPRLCYHMEKHYISGMSDSKAASAASIVL